MLHISGLLSYRHLPTTRDEISPTELALSAFPFAQTENHSSLMILMIAECIHAAVAPPVQ